MFEEQCNDVADAADPVQTARDIDEIKATLASEAIDEIDTRIGSIASVHRYTRKSSVTVAAVTMLLLGIAGSVLIVNVGKPPRDQATGYLISGVFFLVGASMAYVLAGNLRSTLLLGREGLCFLVGRRLRFLLWDEPVRVQIMRQTKGTGRLGFGPGRKYISAIRLWNSNGKLIGLGQDLTEFDRVVKTLREVGLVDANENLA